MNARQRRKAQRLRDRAFGAHVHYAFTLPVPDEWDGIKLCEKCGEYTTGQLCRSCREQNMIDHREG